MALLEINASTLTTAVLATVVLLVLHRLHQAWVERKRLAAEQPSIPRALKRKMSNIGVSTLVSETETNLSIPVSLLTLEGDVSIDEITARLQERMGTDAFFIRFRSRVVGEQRTFIEQPDFDASNHVKSHVLRDGETPTSYLESIVNKPLDFSKPLWEMHVVHTPTKTETHLCWKVHHCIGDGQSLAVALIRLSDNKEQFEKMIDKLQAAKKSEKKALKPFATKAKESAGFLMLCVWSWLVIVRKLGVLIFRTEPATIFKRVGGTQKKLSHQMLYSVSETKRVGKHFNATINDVMLSCIAGAMRKSLQSTGVPVSPKLVLRAAIPVDMRGTNEVVDSARNKFSALVIDFPVGLDDPEKRLKIVRGNMNEAKNSLEKVFTYLSSQIVSRLPDWLMKPVIQFTTSKLSVAISNVRAAAFSLSVCGKPLKGSFGFVPPPPTVNLGVAILSVGDELGLNVLVDPAVGIDGKQFLVYAMDEFKALLAIADAANTTAETKKTQ